MKEYPIEWQMTANNTELIRRYIICAISLDNFFTDFSSVDEFIKENTV